MELVALILVDHGTVPIIALFLSLLPKCLLNSQQMVNSRLDNTF